jgi:hypothetical protein
MKLIDRSGRGLTDKDNETVTWERDAMGFLPHFSGRHTPGPAYEIPTPDSRLGRLRSQNSEPPRSYSYEDSVLLRTQVISRATKWHNVKVYRFMDGRRDSKFLQQTEHGQEQLWHTYNKTAQHGCSTRQCDAQKLLAASECHTYLLSAQCTSRSDIHLAFHEGEMRWSRDVPGNSVVVRHTERPGLLRRPVHGRIVITTYSQSKERVARRKGLNRTPIDNEARQSSTTWQ